MIPLAKARARFRMIGARLGRFYVAFAQNAPCTDN